MSRSHKNHLEISRSDFFMLPSKANATPSFWKKARSDTSFNDLDCDYLVPTRQTAKKTLAVPKSVFHGKGELQRGLWTVHKAATRPRYRLSEDTFTGRLLIPDEVILFEVFEPAPVEILSEDDVTKYAYRLWMK